MKKILLLSMIVQLLIIPCPVYSSLSSESQDGIIPESSTASNDIHKAMELKNELSHLSEKNADGSLFDFQVPLDPWNEAKLKFQIDLTKQKIFCEVFPRQMFEASIDPKTSQAVISILSTTEVSTKLVLQLKRLENGDLTLSTATIQISKINQYTTYYSHTYSDAGEYTGFSFNQIGSGYWRLSNFSKTPDGLWSGLSLVGDLANKTYSIWNSAVSLEDFKTYFHLGIDQKFEWLDKEAQVKSFIDLTSVPALLQYEKDELENWVVRHKSVEDANSYKSYLIDNGVEKVFVQNQKVEGMRELEAYTVSFNIISESGAPGLGLIFSSPSKSFNVHYPKTNVFELDGKKYLISLSDTGKLQFKELNYDFNDNQVLDEQDVQLLSDQVKTGVYNSKYDLNSDGILDINDVELIAAKYMDELQKVASVIIVEPGQSISLAQEEARQLIAAGLTKNLFVFIKSGDYYNTQLILDERDSGNNGHLVTYQGCPGHTAPRLIGGSLLDNSRWQRVVDMPGTVYRMFIDPALLTNEPVSTLFVDGVAARNADSISDGLDVPSGFPEENPLLAHFPNAVFKASNKGLTKTMLGTYLPGNGTPSWEEGYPINISYVLQSDNTYKTIIKHYSNDGSTLLDEEERSGIIDRVAIINEYKQSKSMKAVEILSYQAFQFSPNALPLNFDYNQAKAYFWCNTYTLQEIKIKHIDWATRTIILEDNFGHPITKTLNSNGAYSTKIGLKKFSIKNSQTFLSAGEFYYDGAGSVYYSVPSGKTISNLKFTLPNNRQVIKIEGQIESPVHDVVLSNLDISVSRAIHEVKDLYGDPLKLTTISEEYSALYLNNVQNITIRNSKIHDTGSLGIGIRGVSENVQILNNEMFSIGADAIVLNGDDPSTRTIDPSYFPRQLSRNNLIRGNYLHHIGTIYERGQGIWLVQSSDNHIMDNRIDHVSYNGIHLLGIPDIAMGARGVYRDGPEGTPGYANRYTWNYTNNNLVARNDISHVLLKADDGAAVYTHSAGKNNEIAYNKIHDIYSGVRTGGGSSAFGIYLDGGQSDYFNIHHNHLYNFNSAVVIPITINGSYNRITYNVTEQNNINYSIQFQPAPFNEGNILEHNSFTNLNPQNDRTIKVIFYYNHRVPHRLGDPVPANAHLVRIQTQEEPPTYGYFLYYFTSQLASSDFNQYYNASGRYNFTTGYDTILNYVDTPNGIVRTIYQAGVVPFETWKTILIKGSSVLYDTHSTIGILP